MSFTTLFLLPEIAFSLLSKVLCIFRGRSDYHLFGETFFYGGVEILQTMPLPRLLLV